MAWLIDTNILSEIKRPRPDPHVVRFLTSIPQEDLLTSVVTLAEIRYGIEMQSDPARRAALAVWLDGTVRPMFAGRVLGIDEQTLVTWRFLAETGKRAGYTFSQPDLLIAAIAAEHTLTVVSRDTAPFQAAGVPVVNPFAWQGD